MTRIMFRRVAALAASCCVAVGLATVVSGPAQAATLVTPSAKVTTNGQYYCSLGGIGKDAFGNTVALIAGHCMTRPSDPVSLCVSQTVNTACAGIGQRIGTYTATPSSAWRGSGQPEGAITNWALDYSVIVLSVPASNTTPRGLRITATGNAKAWSQACKDGARTGKTCGTVLGQSGNVIRATTSADHGDSGGPLIQGTTFVGMVSRNGSWGTINYVGVTGILQELAATNAVGKGFVPTP